MTLFYNTVPLRGYECHSRPRGNPDAASTIKYGIMYGSAGMTAAIIF